VRRYHPDRNGGDRSHEARLTEVIDAYNHAAPALFFLKTPSFRERRPVGPKGQLPIGLRNEKKAPLP
jgi:hypothetical protein